jgi:hypothetical protein
MFLDVMDYSSMVFIQHFSKVSHLISVSLIFVTELGDRLNIISRFKIGFQYYKFHI